MSDFRVQGGPAEGEPHPSGHEGTDLALGPIFGFGIGLVVTALVVYLVLGVFMNRFVKESERSKALEPRLFKDDTGQFPAPKNQVKPRIELAEFRERERKVLESYGWVDEKKGTARVPIDRAIDILAERGLPKVKNIAPKGAREASK